jgi:hypothetical protein
MTTWILKEYRPGVDREVARTDDGDQPLLSLLILFVALRTACGKSPYALRLRCYHNGEEIDAAVFENPSEVERQRARARDVFERVASGWAALYERVRESDRGQ